MTDNKDYKAKILWHDVWGQDGPAIGVAWYDNDYAAFIFRKGKYELRRFTPEGWSVISKHHKYFQENYGYYQDHDPDVYRPQSEIKSFFEKIPNYGSNTIPETIAYLQEEEIQWLHPPKSFACKKEQETIPFNSEDTNHGNDINIEASDSDNDE